MGIVKHLLFSLFIIFSVISCSTHVEKLEVKFKDDFSGSIRANIRVDKESTSALEELYKFGNACDVNLKEIQGYDKKFIAEYEFNSYDSLKNATDCSKATSEGIVLYPLDIDDDVLTKDVTLKMGLTGYFSFVDEVIITMPSEIKDASGIYGIRETDNEVSFKPKETFEKAKKEVKEKCGSSASKDCQESVERQYAHVEDDKIIIKIKTKVNRLSKYFK